MTQAASRNQRPLYLFRSVLEACKDNSVGALSGLVMGGSLFWPQALGWILIFAGTSLALVVFAAFALTIISGRSDRDVATVDVSAEAEATSVLARSGLFVLGLVTKPVDREFVQGCAQERFSGDVKLIGYRAALFTFWWDTLFSAVRFLFRRLIAPITTVLAVLGIRNFSTSAASIQ